MKTKILICGALLVWFTGMFVWGVHYIGSIIRQGTSRVELAPYQNTSYATIATHPDQFAISVDKNEVWVIDMSRLSIQIITRNGDKFYFKSETMQPSP